MNRIVDDQGAQHVVAIAPEQLEDKGVTLRMFATGAAATKPTCA
jgi:hypothetical protein